MKTKVTIVVEGGVVQDVYSNDPNIRVQIVDHDNLKEEGKTRTDRDGIEKRARKEMVAVLVA